MQISWNESDALLRPAPATQFSQAHRGLGGGVAIDGFGRRSVSFLPIKEMGVQFVKVDGAIIRKLLASDVAKTKMNAILRVAEAIRIGVVAECVEDQSVLARLRSLNVSHAQGFGIYQPHPIDSVA